MSYRVWIDFKLADATPDKAKADAEIQAAIEAGSWYRLEAHSGAGEFTVLEQSK